MKEYKFQNLSQQNYHSCVPLSQSIGFKQQGQLNDLIVLCVTMCYNVTFLSSLTSAMSWVRSLLGVRRSGGMIISRPSYAIPMVISS